MVAWGAPVAAQGASDTADGFDIEDLDGIESAVSRIYMGDLATVMAPDAESSLFTVTAMAMTFGSEDDANAAFERVSEEINEDVAGEENVELKEERVDGFSDNTVAYSAQVEEDETTYQAFTLLTQDGSELYYTIAVSMEADDSAKDAAIDIASFMIDAEAGDGEGSFSVDGTSTGGLWDKLPTNGDDVLQGLTVSADEQLYPEA